MTREGDGLNSKQPMIEALREQNMNFILVANPDDHVILMEEFEAQKRLNEVKTMRTQREDGSIHEYQWINQIPLHGNAKSVDINFCFYRMIVIQKDASEKAVYRK